MDIVEYLKQQGSTGKVNCKILASVAKRAGCKPATLYMIALGHKQASWKLADAIETATGGIVSKSSVRPDVFGPVLKQTA